jgi:hypothetical protein
MPRVPDFKDLSRARRAANSRFSFKSVINNGTPSSRSIVSPRVPAAPLIAPDPHVAQFFLATNSNDVFSITTDSTVINAAPGVGTINVILDGVNISCTASDTGNKEFVSVTMDDTGLSYQVKYNTDTYLPVNGVERKFYFYNSEGAESIWA